MNDPNYGCVLLAGGSGSRMGGRNKAELEYDRQTFAERIESQLAGTGMPCYLSAAAYEQKLPDGWKMVRDCVSGEDGRYIGPMGGIYSCLLQAEADGLDGLFFAPCDAPAFDASAISALKERIEDGTDAVCFRTPDGRLQATFGWYSVRCIGRMEDAIKCGRYKLSGFFEEIRSKIIDAENHGLDERLFRNINYAEDYRDLRNMTYRPGTEITEENKKENYRVSLEDAVSMLRNLTERITDTEEVSLMEAVGRTLAEDIRAAFDQPPFPRSPLDGYAVIAADTEGASAETPAVLKVIAEVDAGGWFEGVFKPGEAVRIMTGAPIPAGADAVIGQEDTDYGEETVRIYEEMKPHQNYCDQGEDYRAGTVLLSDRTYITPAEAGIIASTGKGRVQVYRKPRILLISTGDEVREPGEELGPGKIYDSNLYTAGTQLTSWGCELSEALHCGDDAEEMCRIIEEKAEAADFVITTGGVSVGKKDIMHDVYRILGVEKTFMHVAIKPGMAMMAGRYRGKHILSLSGNPYAAYMNLHMLVRPVLAAFAGNDHLEMERLQAVLADDYGKKSPTRRFVRAYVNNCIAYIDGHTGGNGDVYSGHGANAVIDIPAGSGILSAGDTVSALLL